MRICKVEDLRQGKTGKAKQLMAGAYGAMRNSSGGDIRQLRKPVILVNYPTFCIRLQPVGQVRRERSDCRVGRGGAGGDGQSCTNDRTGAAYAPDLRLRCISVSRTVHSRAQAGERCSAKRWAKKPER